MSPSYFSKVFLNKIFPIQLVCNSELKENFYHRYNRAAVSEQIQYILNDEPLTTYVTVPGLALITVPFFSLYQSFEQLLQPLVLFPSCVPVCMLKSVID